MFFKSLEDINYGNLTTSNAPSVNAAAIPSGRTSSIGKNLNDWSAVWRNDASMSKFIIRPTEKRGAFTPPIPAVLKPEYFYSVGMLPEGEYFISRIICPLESGALLRKDYQKYERKYYFHIKAGHVNYLGDFYLIEPGAENGTGGLFTSPTYSMGVVVDNKYQTAKAFLKEFHPEIRLPVINSLLQMK
jgi:hypothetical protein